MIQSLVWLEKDHFLDGPIAPLGSEPATGLSHLFFLADLNGHLSDKLINAIFDRTLFAMKHEVNNATSHAESRRQGLRLVAQK